jgi:RNA polymerase sigma-70 factor (ECF subfamily)
MTRNDRPWKISGSRSTFCRGRDLRNVPATTESEELLVERARAGDREAFGRLASVHAPRLAGFAARRLGDPGEAADVTQAALARALEAIATLREPAAFRGWLYEIALNECRRHRLGRGRLRAAYERWRSWRETFGRGRAEPIDDDEAALVRRALVLLPERQRLAVELRVVEGLTGEEAARALGCTVGTIKANLHHGLARLRSEIERGRKGP